MHVEFTAQAEHSGWVGWALGNLAVAVCRAVEVVGPTAGVVTIVATEADGEDGLPVVTLVVEDQAEADRMRDAAENGDYVATFAPVVGGFAWDAVVNGIRIQVALPDLEDSILIYEGGA